MLIDAEELERATTSGAPPTVLDVRWSLLGPPGIDLFRHSHVPGAQFCDLDTDLAGSAQVGAGRHPLPEAFAFQSAMRRVGISGGSAVVVYDASDSSVAARAWWCLRYFGHPNVRVLNGGFAAWEQAKRQVESRDPPPVAPGDFVSRPGGMPVLNADEASALARSGLLIDARAPARYRGDMEPVDPVAGHIPGAVNGPTSTLVDRDGRLLPPNELRAHFASLAELVGERPDPDRLREISLAAYCGSGVTAAQVVFGGFLAGLRPALYVGSWSEWVSDPTRPVAMGPEPG